MAESFAVVAAPGFQTTADVVFEVDPARLADLTIEIWDAEIIRGYHQRVQVPLGITADNAAVLVAQGRELTLRKQPDRKQGLP